MIRCDARQRSERKIAAWIIVIGAMLAALSTRAAAEPVVGATKSKVYHTHPDDCSAAQNINGDNIVRFASEEEAKKEGRRLCKSCAKVDERAKKKAAEPPDTSRPPKSKRPSNIDVDETESEDAPPTNAIEARVKKVLTGGTLLLDNGDKVRLLGLVAPHTGQPLADETVRFIQKQTKGRTVHLAPLEGVATKPRRDGLGRMLAFVALGSGDSDLGGELVSEGLAAVDRSVECERLDDYLKREDDAAWAGRGIWKKLDGPDGEIEVVTGKHTHEYHATDCPHGMHLIEPTTITVNEAKGRRLHPCEYYRVQNGQKN